MSSHIVIINDLSEPKGGASLLAVNSAIAFARQGRRVTFVCGDTGSDALRRENIAIVALGQDRLLEGSRARNAIRGLYNRAARETLARWIADNDSPTTVYHLHGWSQILSPAVFVPLRDVAARLVMSAHDFFVTCPNGAMYDFGAAEPCRLTPMSVKCMIRNCDRRSRAQKMWRVARHAVLAQTRPGFDNFPPQLLIHEGMAPLLAQSGMDRNDMAVLPNPVVPFCGDRVAAEANRAALFVGRIEGTKGIDLAASACRRAGIKLIAVGDGSLLQPLRSAYPEHEWVGRKPPHELAAYARQARMLLMPSILNEPFGLTAVEGLWSGLPVMCSRDSLLAADIAAAGAGCAIDPRDTDGFVAALQGWADDDEAVRVMSMAAYHNTAHLALTWDAWIAGLAEAYAAVLAGSTPRSVVQTVGSLRPAAHLSAPLTRTPAPELHDAAG